MQHLPTNTPQAFTTEILEKKAKLYADHMHIDEVKEADDLAGTEERTPSYFTPSGAAYLEIRRELERRANTTYEQFVQTHDVLHDREYSLSRRGDETGAERAYEERDRLHMQHPEYSKRLMQEAYEAEEEYIREQEHAEQYAHLYGSIEEHRNEQPSA